MIKEPVNLDWAYCDLPHCDKQLPIRLIRVFLSNYCALHWNHITVTQLNFADPGASTTWRPISPDPKTGYTLIDVIGPDAAIFLQGQLTADINNLETGQCTAGALCNPQGRVMSYGEILRSDQEHFQLMIPMPLADLTLNTLKRYVMRSKLTLNLSSDAVGLQPIDSLEPGHIQHTHQSVSWRPRWNTQHNWAFTTAPMDGTSPLLSWQQAQWLWAQAPHASEQFLPQMLNLDALGAVHFEKGCYTGQEVIARVHFRGSVKRRLRRFVVSTPADANDEFSAGVNVLNSNGETVGEVISNCHDEAGNIGVLAMMRAAHWDSKEHYTIGKNALQHVPLPYLIEPRE